MHHPVLDTLHQSGVLCAQAGVRHVVFSTLEDVPKLLPKGAMPELTKEPGRVVAHFESKAAVLVCYPPYILSSSLLSSSV